MVPRVGRGFERQVNDFVYVFSAVRLALTLKRGREGDDHSFLSSAERSKGNDVWGFWSSGSYCGESVPTSFWAAKSFSFRPTSKRRGVWARTVKRSLVPTVKWRECPLEGGAQGSICTVSPRGKIHLSLGAMLIFVQVQ